MQRKNLLITLGVVVAVFVLPNLDRLQNKARQTIASAAGKAAVTNMSGVVAENNAGGLAAAQLITLPIAVSEVAPGIFQASGVGNSFAIKTNEGSVIFDTGLIIQASNQIAKLKAAVGEEEPKKIILSHSHADHVGGTRLWDQGSAEIVAHEEFEEEQRYLTELNPYLHQRNRTLFPWIIIDKEQELVAEELKNSGKPDEIAKKISLGKMSKFKEENALLSQAWVMEPKKKVQDILKELSIPDLKIKEFVRFKIGE